MGDYQKCPVCDGLGTMRLPLAWKSRATSRLVDDFFGPYVCFECKGDGTVQQPVPATKE